MNFEIFTWLAGVAVLICVSSVIGAKIMRKINDRQRKKESAERHRKFMEENERRSVLRLRFLQQNGVDLYINTVNGITAVLTAEKHSQCLEQTKYGRMDRVWNHKHSLAPVIPGTYVFATKHGQEWISKKVGDYYKCHPLSELHKIAAEAMERGIDVRLRRDERIFVPFASEGLVSFRNQQEWFRPEYHEATYSDLIDAQAPTDLQAIRYKISC